MLAVRACLLLSRLFSTGPLARYGTLNVHQTRSVETCVTDRVSSVPGYHALFSEFCSLRDKTVLELGCSRGYLLASLLDLEPFRALGIDKDALALEDGAARYRDRIEFLRSDDVSIPLADSTGDVVYTVDTVEHLSRPFDIFSEVHRVLRPGGLFLVHFHPWFGPYGAHLSEILPFPWPHVVFSMTTLLKAAALRYESPDYEPPFYRIDPATGRRRDNPYRGDWSYYLNPEMTIRGFRRFLRRLPFRVVHLRRIGFGGKGAPLARYLRPLAQVPVLDEFFSSAVFCVLQKAEITAGREAPAAPLPHHHGSRSAAAGRS
jgi:SAM-dependent methyltransferase